ncbi:thiamine-binding protein, partial [Streptomyces sp. NPDC079189]|uniref:thiamine-binding protein n=1 Tax=Streptomyces sp. NPDC079189 TaxID=3154514 RepID=UPI003426CB9A
MIVAFSVSPLGVGEDVGEYVADAVRVVRESGLPNRTDAIPDLRRESRPSGRAGMRSLARRRGAP